MGEFLYSETLYVALALIPVALIEISLMIGFIHGVRRRE